MSFEHLLAEPPPSTLDSDRAAWVYLARGEPSGGPLAALAKGEPHDGAGLSERDRTFVALASSRFDEARAHAAAVSPDDPFFDLVSRLTEGPLDGLRIHWVELFGRVSGDEPGTLASLAYAALASHQRTHTFSDVRAEVPSAFRRALRGEW